MVVLIFMDGCTLDDPGATNNSPALTLHADQNLSLLTLSWDPVNVTGFREYIIVQSTSDIPNTSEPEVNSETIVLKRIDDRSVHSLTISNTLFAPTLCFKLFASVNDRFISSSSICVQQDFTLFSGFHDRAGHEAGLDEIVLFDRSNARLSTINYKTETLTNTISENSLTFPIINVSTYEGTTTIFAYDQSPPRLRKYRYPDLVALTFKDFPGVLFALQPYKQFVFVADEDFNKGFQVLNTGNLNLIDSRPGISGNRNIAVFEGSPLTVLEIAENSTWKYTIDATGKIIGSEQLLHGVTQLSSQNTTANNQDYFIGGRFGNIVNRDGEIIASISSGINSFVSMNRFSPDDSKVVSIINDNILIRLEINDVSALPGIETIVSYELPSASYADLIVDENIIYVIGVTFATSQPQTFILKYPY
jgi:hypothetical protein